MGYSPWGRKESNRTEHKEAQRRGPLLDLEENYSGLRSPLLNIFTEL